jgi:hypothetical protein
VSRPSSTDARYQMYANAFENPETDESIERGWRVLHDEFTEAWHPRDAVANRVRRAQDTARQRAGLPPRASARGRSR